MVHRAFLLVRLRRCLLEDHLICQLVFHTAVIRDRVVPVPVLRVWPARLQRIGNTRHHKLRITMTGLWRLLSGGWMVPEEIKFAIQLIRQTGVSLICRSFKLPGSCGLCRDF